MNQRHKNLRLKYWKLFLKFPSLWTVPSRPPAVRLCKAEMQESKISPIAVDVETPVVRCRIFEAPTVHLGQTFCRCCISEMAYVGSLSQNWHSLTFFGSLGSDWWMVWRPRATSSRTPFLIGTASVERSPTGMGNGDWCGRNSDQNKRHEAKVVVSCIL